MLIPLLSKEGVARSAGVVTKVAQPPYNYREASTFSIGALREHLKGGFALLLTTLSAVRTTPPLEGGESSAT
jgi:hypothetical protein